MPVFPIVDFTRLEYELVADKFIPCDGCCPATSRAKIDAMLLDRCFNPLMIDLYDLAMYLLKEDRTNKNVIQQDCLESSTSIHCHITVILHAKLVKLAWTITGEDLRHYTLKS